MNRYFYYLLSLSTVLLVGCGKDPENTEVVPPKVKVVKLSNRTSGGDKLYFPAVAHAADRSHLSFRVAGEIVKLYVKEGDRLKKGAIIAQLDPTDYKLDVDNALARYNVVDSQYSRSKALVDKGSLAKSQFDEIAANRQIAKAELELAKLRLSYTKLRAPVDGIISRVNTDQFENVRVGQQIVNIQSTENIEVLIQLPDRLYIKQSSKKALSQVEAIVKVPSGNEYDARIKEFTTEPDPQTATFTVTLIMPMPKEEYILDGMAVEVTARNQNIEMDVGNVVNVPIEAIFNADGDDLARDKKYVWCVKEDNTVTKRQVIAGNAHKDSVQILDGLSRGEHVVIAGISRLREGMKVEVIEQGADDE